MTATTENTKEYYVDKKYTEQDMQNAIMSVRPLSFNNLVFEILRMATTYMNYGGVSRVQELTLSKQAFEELKEFGKWNDDNRVEVLVSKPWEEPRFAFISDLMLPQIENGIFVYAGYTFNIKTEE